MRWVAILAALSALAAAGATAAPNRKGLYSDTQIGLSVRVPAGWHVVRRRLTPCSNPIERLTVVGRGALVMLQESLGPLLTTNHFSPRPSRFELGGKPYPMECCAPRGSPGWSFNFGEGGRGFYAYVYPGRSGTRREALSILDSLRVEPRQA